MGIVLRTIFATISTAIIYFIYVYLPGLLLGVDESILEGGQAGIRLPDVNQLAFYLRSIGIIIVGVTFAHGFAPGESKIKPIWNVIRVILKVFFFGAIIYIGFSIIEIYIDIELAFYLGLNVDLTVFWYSLMGAILFDIVISVLDFFIAFQEADNEKPAGTVPYQTMDLTEDGN